MKTTTDKKPDAAKYMREGSEKVHALKKRIEHLRKDKNTVSFSQENFFKTYRKKIANASS